MVYAKFGGQTECIMGNWKIENAEFCIADRTTWILNYDTYRTQNGAVDSRFAIIV